jgi:hypothetical protein
MEPVWRSRALFFEMGNGERKERLTRCRGAMVRQEASPGPVCIWGRITRRYGQSINGCARGERPPALLTGARGELAVTCGKLHQIAPNDGRDTPVRQTSRLQKPRDGHASCENHPITHAKRAFFASCRNLRFFPGKAANRRQAQRAMPGQTGCDWVDQCANPETRRPSTMRI